MKSVLLVEREAQTRDAIKLMIQNLGFRVVAVDDLVRARQIMSYVLFDVVCTAYDDALITRAENTDPPTGVILLLEKHFDPAQVIRFDSLLSKPFSMARLREAIELATFENGEAKSVNRQDF